MQVRADQITNLKAEKQVKIMKLYLKKKKKDRKLYTPKPATPHPAPSSITRFPFSLEGLNLPLLQFFSCKIKAVIKKLAEKFRESYIAFTNNINFTL